MLTERWGRVVPRPFAEQQGCSFAMNVAEELTEFESRIDAAHVEQRVQDWEKRIASLYAQVGAWLPDHWRSRVTDTISMNEPLMQNYVVAARNLPVLTVFENDRRVVTFTPRGLWIIGANGRIDIVKGSERFVLLDAADNFEPPRWKVSPFFQRQQERDFTPSALSDILM